MLWCLKDLPVEEISHRDLSQMVDFANAAGSLTTTKGGAIPALPSIEEIRVCHANLKYKYGNRHFWCRGYYVDTVGKNTEKIAEYIRNQLQEDIMNDQISIKEYIDPFTGSKNTKA